MLKPGKSTTEFWLSLLAALVGVGIYVAESLKDTPSVLVQAIGLAATALTSLGYTVPRLGAKKTELAAQAESEKAESLRFAAMAEASKGSEGGSPDVPKLKK